LICIFLIIKKGVKVKGSDVNSLYPSRMRDCDMAVGNPIFFKGDIRLIDANAFGFFYCEIIAPNNIKHPIIQTHVKTHGGIRTIAPIGIWEDMLFSAEMDNAKKYGYQFKILWGYKFERKIIFKSYVDNLYSLRQQFPKTNPLNYIAKLLLNSLYGRFGMEDSFSDNIIINDLKTLKEFMKNHSDDIINMIDFNNNQTFIQYRPKSKDVNTELYGTLETHNTNVAIASAITAYARIHMSYFKNNPNFNLYYSDTDSAYIDRPLPKDMVSSTILGKLKLENVLNKAIFLAPKVYYLETIDSKDIYKVKGLKHKVELTKT